MASTPDQVRKQHEREYRERKATALSALLPRLRAQVDPNANDRKKCCYCAKMIKGLDYKRFVRGSQYVLPGQPWRHYYEDQPKYLASYHVARTMGGGPHNWVFDKTGAIAAIASRGRKSLACTACNVEHERRFIHIMRTRARENRAARKIQGAFRAYQFRRREAAAAIQTAWRRCRWHPSYLMCKKIQLGELADLGAISEEDYVAALGHDTRMLGYASPGALPPCAV